MLNCERTAVSSGLKASADILPKISIITPSFNQAAFIESTILSVLSQNYPNLEYIVIDGGSTDGTVEIIKKYEDRLHFWCSEPDEGTFHASNKGFAQASGDILGWIGSDDMYFPWAFRTVASIFSEHSEIDWLTTLRPGSWDWNGFCTRIGEFPGYSKEAFLDGCYIPSAVATGIPQLSLFDDYIQLESTFWRRCLWDKAGGLFDVNYKLAADFDLWSRFFLYADLYGTASPLAGFRTREGQLSRDRKVYGAEVERSLTAMRRAVGWSPSSIRFRSAYRNLGLWKIPKLRGYLERKGRYTGRKVIRRGQGRPDGYWEIVTYKF